MTDEVEKVVEAPKKMTPRERAELILKMTNQADRLGRKLGAEACIVLCVFKDGGVLTIQDAGRFVMPPEQLYDAMANAHANGKMSDKPRILRPN